MSARENQIVTQDPNDIVSEDAIRMMIVPVRGVQVMLDRDWAALYGVEVKYLNRQVKRNIERFPSDFMFQLTKSKFRSRFHLSEADRKYVADKGLETIRSHCEDFIRTRLAPANPSNDGKQTPMRGHPVFKAQHACACCCCGCLANWWHVPCGVPIPADRQHGIVDFLYGDPKCLGERSVHFGAKISALCLNHQ